MTVSACFNVSESEWKIEDGSNECQHWIGEMREWFYNTIIQGKERGRQSK